MKTKMYLTRQCVFALGFILFFINPSVALAADAVTHLEEIEGTAGAQSTGEDARKLEISSNEFSLQSKQRMRLQTVNNITRSQQSNQRINVAHPHML